MATQLTERQQQGNPLVAFNNQLSSRAEQFRMVLPSHIEPDKFQRTVMTAVQSDPDLLRADRQSLLLACMKAAQDGLLPDKREAALVIFNTRQKNQQSGQWESIKLVQYMPMVFGLRKKILQSGEISSIETNVVYRREVEEGYFVYEAGTEAMLRHKPMLDLTDADLADENIVAAYSVAVMKDGTKSFEVMRRADINKVREKSQTGATLDRLGKPRDPSGPWADWFSEMARKTVMRRHSKTLPMSGDILDVEARDDNLHAASTQLVLGSAEPDAPTVADQRVPTRADLTHDPETGEVLDEATARALDRQSFREMDGNDGTLSEDNPTATEGRADDDYGEQHDGDFSGYVQTDTSACNDLIARIRACTLIADVLALEKAYQGGGREMFNVAEQDRIETVIGEAKAARKGCK
jgi:recombination protein RecT